jgi:2'-5' RNA ligase
MRLFIAINLPESTKTTIRELVKELRIDNDPVRWITPSNIHLTLKFLGEVDPSLHEQVIGVIEETIPNYPSFELTLSDFGAFPNLRRPRIIWIGTEARNAPTVLNSIYSDLEKGFVPLGFEREGRRFKPHLTIGRVRGGRRRCGSMYDSMEARFAGIEVEEDSFRVDSVELMESILKRSGAEYHIKSSVSLQRTDLPGTHR